MSSNPRQLNIGDDEIYVRAHGLAKRMDVSTKEAVQAALAAFQPDDLRSTEEREIERHDADLDAILDRLSKKVIKRTPPKTTPI